MKLVIEAFRSAVTAPVSSIVTALIIGGVCAAILSTTGQTVQAEQQVLGQIDAAGTRSIVISDAQGTAGMTSQSVERISQLSGIEWVIGLGPAFDVRPAANPGGDPVAVRTVHGDLPPQVSATLPPVGRAIAGTAAIGTLGFKTPYGGVSGDRGDLAVSGMFAAREPLAFLDRSILTAPTKTDDAVRTSQILVTDSRLVAQTADAALSVLAPENPTSVAVETSETLASVRAAVQGELGRSGRQLVTLVLTAGLVLTALNVYGTVTSRRRDFGRRRALGASRPTIIGLIAAQTTITAIFGAALGTAVTSIVLIETTGEPPDARFAVAIAALATIAALVAAIPPGLVAAYRDPVRILRVP